MEDVSDDARLHAFKMRRVHCGNLPIPNPLRMRGWRRRSFTLQQGRERPLSAITNSNYEEYKAVACFLLLGPCTKFNRRNLYDTMFGFLKNLLGRQATASANEAAAGAATPLQSGSQPAGAPPAETVDEASAAPPPPRNGSSGLGNGVEVPLQPVLAGLPLELQSKVRRTDVGDATILVPLERILAQLAHGTVKITFSELRQSAPKVFVAAPELDRVMVTLPLGEILPRINPSLIKRRRVQKTVEVPDEISSPFDEAARAIAAPACSSGKTDFISRARLGPNGNTTSFHRTVPVNPPGAVPPNRHNLTAAPALEPPGAIPPRPMAAPLARLEPEPPLPERQGLKEPIAGRKPAAPVPEPPAPASISPPPAPVKATPLPANVQPVVSASPGNGNGSGNGILPIGLATLADGWPEAVRKEIIQLNLAEAKVALPKEAVERALKQGRIAFTWRMLRSWIKPSPLPTVSAQDGTILELPLNVIAPLFLSKQREAQKSRAKIDIDENIPNLFFGFPQPESAPGGAAATAKPADTNYYVWDDRADTVRVAASEVKMGPSVGTKFVSKYATPNEIVSRAAALDGVAGALIALPDGLLVASRVPSEFNGDTLAAFLPQIFGKVSQCTKELRMGDLNNLNFTVGNVPWKIFRVNAIFFAAFGRTGEPLPTAQLAALAAELDHKPKAL